MSQPRFVHNLIPLEHVDPYDTEVEYAHPPNTRCVATYYPKIASRRAQVIVTPCDSIGRPRGSYGWSLNFDEYHPRVATVKEQEYYQVCKRKRQMEKEADDAS